MDETLPYLTSVIEVEGGHDFPAQENPMEASTAGDLTDGVNSVRVVFIR